MGAWRYGSAGRIRSGVSSLSVLKIDMTYQCTAECEHCRFRCTPDRRPVIDLEMAVGCIRELVKLNDLGLVVIMGGEPGLYRAEMLALLSTAHGLGLATRLETNAFWAENEASARRFLQELRAMNTQVAVSLDAFHAPFVPAERVVTAVRVSEEIGVDCWVDTTYVDPANRSAEEDILTARLVADAEKALGHRLERHYQGRVFYAGRSTDRLAHTVKHSRGVPAECCAEVPWWTGSSLEDLQLLSLDPDGYLSKGCGIAIGNVTQEPVSDIIASFNAREHPIFAVLLERGPVGLAEEASELGFEVESDYADRCHLCQEAREILRARYPEYLTPAQHYR